MPTIAPDSFPSVPTLNTVPPELAVSELAVSELAGSNPTGLATAKPSPATSLADVPATTHRFDHGLTLIHQWMPTPVVTVDVWVRAGAVLEPPEWLGMAHFLEHMIFKGTERFGPGVFDGAIEGCGGLTNAGTSHDYAHYYITVAADQIAEMLPYLADLLLNATILADEFERERLVVLEEIRQYQDNPDSVGYQALLAQVYGDHPYGRPVLGTEAILMARSPEDMRRFHRTHYQPQNMTVAVAGGIELEACRTLIAKQFGQFAAPLDCPPLELYAAPVMTGILRQELRLPNVEEPRLMMAWLAPGMGLGTEAIQTMVGLELVATVLTGGRTARLVNDLREERQWVLDIQASYSLQKESGLMMISAWLESEHVAAVEGAIVEHLRLLQAEGITEAELRRCQQMLCNDFAFSLETPSQLASLYGYYGALSDPALALEYPNWVRQVTREQVQDLAQCYLPIAAYAVTILWPEEERLNA
jgi:zinc protease